MNIVGEYRHGVDDKGRVTLPSRMRSELGGEFTLKLAPHGACIWLYPDPVWNHLASRFQPEDLMDMENYGLMQDFVEGATRLSLDKASRLTLPQHIRDGLGIKGDVVINGLLMVIEIWSAESWESRTPESKEKMRKATSKFFRGERKAPQAPVMATTSPSAGDASGGGE